MVLLKKFKILLTFCFMLNTPRKVFGAVLVRKQAFLDDINMDLKRTQNSHFSKGNSP